MSALRSFAIALVLVGSAWADQIPWTGSRPIAPDPYTGAYVPQTGPAFGVQLDDGTGNGRMSFKVTAHEDERLAGYRLHYGTSTGTYTAMYDCGKSLESACTVTGLTNSTTYYFAATAYAAGVTLESTYSSELSGQP